MITPPKTWLELLDSCPNNTARNTNAASLQKLTSTSVERASTIAASLGSDPHLIVMFLQHDLSIGFTHHFQAFQTPVWESSHPYLNSMIGLFGVGEVSTPITVPMASLTRGLLVSAPTMEDILTCHDKIKDKTETSFESVPSPAFPSAITQKTKTDTRIQAWK